MIALGTRIEKIGNSEYRREDGRYLRAGCIGNVVLVKYESFIVMFPTWGRALFKNDEEGTVWRRL